MKNAVPELFTMQQQIKRQYDRQSDIHDSANRVGQLGKDTSAQALKLRGELQLKLCGKPG